MKSISPPPRGRHLPTSSHFCAALPRPFVICNNSHFFPVQLFNFKVATSFGWGGGFGGDYFSRVPGLKQPNSDTDGAEMSSTPGDTSRRLQLSDLRRAVKSEGRRSLAFPLQSGSSYSTWLQPDNSIRCLFSCPRAWLQNPKSPSTPSGLGCLDCK